MSGTVIVITGTSTGVGKTIATAALALQYAQLGSVVVVKPVQTGIPLVSSPSATAPTSGAPSMTPPAVEPADAEVIHRLSGAQTQEFVCLEDPLAPDTAARLRGVRIPPLAEHIDRIRVLTDFYDYVLVEGAGGLLVRLDTQGGTLLDLAAELSAEVYVVSAAGLGTLNHTELTCWALRRRGIEPVGLIIGSWPDDPGLAETCNLTDLPTITGVPLVAILPEKSGELTRAQFTKRVTTAFRSST